MKSYNYLSSEDINRETLLLNEDFLDDAASYLYKRTEGEVDATDPDEIYEEFVKRMRYHDVNEVDTVSDLMYAQEADEDSKAEMARLFDVYDRTEMSLEDIGDKALDYGAGILTAPSTILGVLTGGSGKLASVTAQTATKALVRKSLAGALKGALVEGAIGAGQSVAQQATRMEVDPDREFSMSELALTTGASALPGAVFGGASAFRQGALQVDAAVLKGQAEEASARIQSEAVQRAEETIAKAADADPDAVKNVTTVLDELNVLTDKTQKLDPLDPLRVKEGEELKLGIEQVEGFEMRLSQEKVNQMTAAVLDMSDVVKVNKNERITSAISRALADGDVPTTMFTDIMEKYNLTGAEMGLILEADVSNAARLMRSMGIIKNNHYKKIMELKGKAEQLAEETGIGRQGANFKNEVAAEQNVKSLVQTLNGFERVRRSIMTSQPVTTIRNAFGAASRFSLDAVEEFISASTHHLYNKLVPRIPGAEKLPQRSVFNSGDLAKYVVNTPEADLIADMYRNIDQEGYDRFFRGFIDSSVASSKVYGGGMLERSGNFFNYFNKMSDNFFKKAAFSGQLSRLTQANYGKDLIDIIKEGKFNTIDPKLFNEAMDKSYELLYQKTPKGQGTLARMANGYLKIDKQAGFLTGLLIPFPRFVINQLEFMYEHIPVIGMIPLEKLGAPKGKVKVDYGDKFAKTITGALGIYGFMSLRNTQEPGVAWHDVETEQGKVDLRPFLGPMNLELYMADYIVKLRNGQPTPSATGLTQDLVQTAIGSSMRAGTGLWLINEAVPQLAGMFEDDKPTLQFEENIGRLAGDWLNTFTIAMPVAVARDLYSLTDEQLRNIPESGGQIDLFDVMFARAGRSLGPFHNNMEGPALDEVRYDVLRPEQTGKPDPFRTSVTGLNISARANEVEKEATRLQLKPYELYRKFKFGPADVEIRKNVSQRLAPLMSSYIRGAEYQGLDTDAKKKLFFQQKAKEIIRESSKPVFDVLVSKIDQYKENNAGADEEQIREALGYNSNDIARYKYETQTRNIRKAVESELGEATDDTNFAEYYSRALEFGGAELAEGGLVQSFNVGGAVGDPLALSETLEEENVATREQEGEEFVKQMTELGLDLAPVTGEIRSFQQGMKDFEEGNPFMGTLGVIGALPLLGMFGRGAKKAYKIAKDIELPSDATEFSGELVLQHASRNPDLQQFKPVEGVRREVPSTYGRDQMEPNPMLYPENVFGEKALYMDYEDGDFVSGAMDSPGFKVGKHVYQVNTNFDRAYVVTPETLDKFAPLYKELEEKGMRIEDLPDLLKEKGYDGLIIRGFTEKYDDAMSKYKVDTGDFDPFESREMTDRYNKAKDEFDKPFEELGLPTDIGQDQILDFYPERIKVSKKVSEGESLGFRTNKAPLEGHSVPDALEMTDEQIATLRESRKKRNPEVVKRFDEIEEAAKKVQSGEMPVEEFRKIADTIKPVRVWDDLPKMASNEEIASGIKPNQLANGIVGLTKSIPDGTRMTSRLDIPAYSDYDTWVVTLKGMDKGERNVYAPAVMLKNVDLNQSMSNQTKAMKVAAGAQKGPFAVMEGDYMDVYPQDIYAYADGVMDNPNWTQVGYDPTRRGYFYDRKTMEPVLAADEIIQIGPLVLAKNASKGDPKDFAFNRGGLMSRK